MLAYLASISFEWYYKKMSTVGDSEKKMQIVNVLRFLYRNGHRGKIVCKTTAAGWTWPGLPTHARACLEF